MISEAAVLHERGWFCTHEAACSMMPFDRGDGTYGKRHIAKLSDVFSYEGDISEVSGEEEVDVLIKQPKLAYKGIITGYNKVTNTVRIELKQTMDSADYTTILNKIKQWQQDKF